MGTKKRSRYIKKNRSYKQIGGAGEDDIIPAIVAAVTAQPIVPNTDTDIIPAIVAAVTSQPAPIVPNTDTDIIPAIVAAVTSQTEAQTEAKAKTEADKVTKELLDDGKGLIYATEEGAKAGSQITGKKFTHIYNLTVSYTTNTTTTTTYNIIKDTSPQVMRGNIDIQDKNNIENSLNEKKNMRRIVTQENALKNNTKVRLDDAVKQAAESRFDRTHAAHKISYTLTYEHTYDPHIFEIADLIGKNIPNGTIKEKLKTFYQKYESEFSAFMTTFNRTQSGGFPNLKDFFNSSTTSGNALDSRSATERLTQKYLPKIRGDTPPLLTPEREEFLIAFFKLSTFDLKEEVFLENAKIEQRLVDEFFTKFMTEYFRMLNANRNNLFNYSKFYELIATTLLKIFKEKFPNDKPNKSLLFNSQNKKIRDYIFFCYKDIISIENAIKGSDDPNKAVYDLLKERYKTQVEGTVTPTVEGDNESLKFALKHIFGVETSLKAREKIKAIDVIIDSITISNFETELKKIIELMNTKTDATKTDATKTTNTSISNDVKTITHTLPDQILDALKAAKADAEDKAVKPLGAAVDSTVIPLVATIAGT